ncbi:hypothetical protein CBS101457_004240 [Exobasidium rhododendri]|nr:hypothetical protein CBS101457_004240 [Exobasidium rhododendri]
MAAANDSTLSSCTSSLQAQCVYTASSANRASHVADWALVEGTDELVYASHKNIVLARCVGSRHPPPTQLIATSNGALTVVKFAFSTLQTQAPRIVAASSDGYLHLLSKGSHEQSSTGWIISKSWASTGAAAQQRAAHLPGRKSKAEGGVSIRALGVLRPALPWTTETTSEDTIFVSAASDGIFKVWKVGNDGDVTLTQSATLGKSRLEKNTEVLPLDIALISLPPPSGDPASTTIMMAVAGTDGKVDVWLSEGREFQFKRLFSLMGHSDWVRSVDFCQVQSSPVPMLMLATGSQDGTVRLWRVERTASTGAEATVSASAKPLDEFERLAMAIEESTEEETIATKTQSFLYDDHRWDVSLDALLSGHEHWISGTRWAPLDGDRQPAALLSSSADNSVIQWVPCSSVTEVVSSTVIPSFASITRSAQMQSNSEIEEQDVWVSVQRFGELGNVGSAANGMYGALWDPSMSSSRTRQAAIGHGYGGAIHLWSRESRDGHLQAWKSQSGLGGHFAPSTCVRWEPGGQYIISGGLDKTTRLHGCFREEDRERSWHEMARPQTHGFEIVSLAWLSRLAFASAGDEKIIRAFEAPEGFVQTMQSLTNVVEDEAGKSSLLAFRLPSLEYLVDSKHLEEPIKQATRRSLSSKNRLTILAVSPLFDGLEEQGRPRLSFEQAEEFLKSCYSLAWMLAVEKEDLLFEVDVLFVGDDRAEKFIESLEEQREYFVVDEPSCALNSATLSSKAVKLPTTCAVQAGEANSDKLIPQHRVVALGGTFDHLHVGHKILLSMAALCATSKIIVGVTDDSMLSKKKCAHLLEGVDVRIHRVATFLGNFRRPLYDLEYDVVKLQDVAGPAGTEANIDALLFTEETVSGADFIDTERSKNGLHPLERLFIGVIGAQGETKLKGKDASELAASKVGSTAIRQWLEGRSKDTKITPLHQVATLSGEGRPVGASVPPLGLSNRSIFASNDLHDGPSETGQPLGKAQESIASHLTRPPVEEELHNNTLWCEVTKLYGHNLELLSIDVDLSSGLIVSSCKGKSELVAGIRIHDRRQGWKEIQVLYGHSLDVTKVRFSPCGLYLASVSRDRSWRLFRKGKQDGLFRLVEAREAHSRIIYDVAWSLSSSLFATASRDNTVKVWTISRNRESGDDTIQLRSTLHFNEPITAVAFTRKDRLAVGSERGNAFIYDLVTDIGTAGAGSQQVRSLSGLHSEAISELAWRPAQPEEGNNDGEHMLASSSLDGSVRLHRISH